MGKKSKPYTWEIIITLAPTSFTAPKIALAVPGTPAIPVLQNYTISGEWFHWREKNYLIHHIYIYNLLND